MLTVHDCTFDLTHKGWGQYWPYADLALLGAAMKILNLSEGEIRSLHRSPVKRRQMALATRQGVVGLIEKSGPKTSKTGAVQARKPAPEGGQILIEAIPQSKAK